MSDKRYLVQKVLKFRVREGIREYFLKWQYYSNKHNTWEPEENLSPDLVEEYHSSKKAEKIIGIFNIKYILFSVCFYAYICIFLSVKKVGNEIFYLTKFTTGFDLTSSAIAQLNYPKLVVDFYIDRLVYVETSEVAGNNDLKGLIQPCEREIEAVVGKF